MQGGKESQHNAVQTQENGKPDALYVGHSNSPEEMGERFQGQQLLMLRCGPCAKASPCNMSIKSNQYAAAVCKHPLA